MNWRIRCDDENGRFWLAGEGRWSDSLGDGMVFAVEDEARALALELQAKANTNPDWFPKIKVVTFKEVV
jgi:hypothetical protein